MTRILPGAVAETELLSWPAPGGVASGVLSTGLCSEYIEASEGLLSCSLCWGAGTRHVLAADRQARAIVVVRRCSAPAVELDTGKSRFWSIARALRHSRVLSGFPVPVAGRGSPRQSARAGIIP